VDHEENILLAYQRQLRKEFQIETALGGGPAPEAIAQRGPYAVIVSDMRMPGMDGVQFLSKVKERAPDSVRMMLTGNNDLQTAMQAVNEGNSFRFLTKPCTPETLAKALEAGLEQYRLITAERELLEKTPERIDPGAHGDSLDYRSSIVWPRRDAAGPGPNSGPENGR
jgi:DNA-binding NtrC family response regulator